MAEALNVDGWSGKNSVRHLLISPLLAALTHFKNKALPPGATEDRAGQRRQINVFNDIKTTPRRLIQEAIADLESQFGSRAEGVCLKLAKAAELLRLQSLRCIQIRKKYGPPL
jgi:hypothetical protein